jgi:hypothetical protein
MVFGLDFAVFSLGFILTYLLNPIAATIFLYHSDVPLYITLPVMMVSTYVNTYVTYCGIGNAVGALPQLAARRLKFALPHSSRPFPINVFRRIARSVRSLGLHIAERHPAIIFIIFVLAPLPLLPSAMIVGLRLVRPRGVVPLLITMNFFRTIFFVTSVYYFPQLVQLGMQ